MNEKINQFRKIHAYFIVVLSITLFSIIYPLDVPAQEFHSQWGSFGDGDGQFNGPTGIAIDSLNNVYVVDTGNSRIQKFSSDGEFILAWGANGSGDGQFKSPLGIGINSNDEIYIVDTINNRIQVFSQTLSPTYSLHNSWWNYSWTNLRVVDENGPQCETFCDSSGSILIYQIKYGAVSNALNGNIYRGFVSSNTYNI